MLLEVASALVILKEFWGSIVAVLFLTVFKRMTQALVGFFKLLAGILYNESTSLVALARSAQWKLLSCVASPSRAVSALAAPKGYS
eukprot:1033310-Amphidinium_carterae.2